MQIRTRTALIAAGASAALLVLTWVAAFHTAVGARADRAILHGFVGLQRPRVNALAGFITRLCDPKPFLGFCAVIVLLALLRRRPRIALAAGAILLCATGTTELLKAVLPAARFLPGLAHAARSWPSGHATAAMALALCAVLVAPRRLRPVVAVVGAAFAVAVGYSTLTLVWHYPSDVFAGFLVAGTWTLLVVAALLWVEARRSVTRGTEDGGRLPLRSALTAPAAGCAVAAAMVGTVLLVRPHQLLSYARIHTAFVVGAGAIAALSLVVATMVMLVRR